MTWTDEQIEAAAKAGYERARAIAMDEDDSDADALPWDEVVPEQSEFWLSIIRAALAAVSAGPEPEWEYGLPSSVDRRNIVPMGRVREYAEAKLLPGERLWQRVPAGQWVKVDA